LGSHFYDESPGDDERRDRGEEERDEGGADEAHQRLAGGEGVVEEHDGLVGDTEEIEETTGGCSGSFVLLFFLSSQG